MNVQAVCTPDLKFSNIVARWKGSTHDSRIWLNSRLCSRFEVNEFQGYVLGDNGYACSNYLLTPVLNPRTESERRYNKAHIRTRNSVERMFGVWKSRFQCLRQTLRFSPVKCCRIIIATAIVHNFVMERHEDLPEALMMADEDNDEQDPVVANAENDRNTNAIRRRIINTVFNQ